MERIQAICEALKAAVPLSEFQRIWQVGRERGRGAQTLMFCGTGSVGLQPSN